MSVQTQVTCPSCSTSFKAKAELAGRRVKCPKCHAPVPVPSATPDEEDDAGSTSVPRWLMLGAAVLIALAVGAAGGVVFGHRQGRSDDKRELAEAQTRAQSMTEKLQASEASLTKIQAEREKLRLELAATVQDREAKLAAARQREDAASGRAREADQKLAAGAAAEADANARRREEEARKAETTKKVQAARGNPTKVLFKDFANFPEEYAGGCVRFDSVWLDGDFDRVEGTKDFSPGVSSRDGKHIFGTKSLRFAEGAKFIISEEIGRPLSVTFESNKKYGVNLCCEVTKNGKLYLTRIYRVETLTVGGDVKEVFEDK